MSTDAPEPDAVTKVARNLSAIEDMTAQLLTQAVHKANDPLMPGGMAMVVLAPDANLDEWSEQIAAAELKHYATCLKDSHGDCTIAGAEHVEDEDDQWAEDPLRTLLFWTDDLRETHGYPLEGRRPTIATEAGLLRHMLNWLWENEAHFYDMARDVHRVRLRLEDMLRDGRRAERSRVVCPNCENGPRLIRVYGQTEAFDGWKCPTCKQRFDADDLQRAQAKQLRSQGAQRFVPFRDALATLRDQGRPERTARQWVLDGEVEGYCDRRSRTLWVWWPDMWRLHLTTPTRKRAAS